MADDGQARPPAGAPGDGQRVFYILVSALAAIIGFLAVTIAGRMEDGSAGREVFSGPQPEAATEPAQGQSSGMARLVRVAPPGPLADFAFEDGDGKPHSLSEWKGKVVLLNLWATWCAPCKEEMPSLDRLQAKLGARDFTVLAISLDRNGADAPRKFLASGNISHLGLYLDKGGQLIQVLKAHGLPLTVLIDGQGRQIARLAGPAQWDGAAAEAVIRAAIAAQGG